MNMQTNSAPCGMDYYVDIIVYCYVYSKLDLKSSYWQRCVDPEQKIVIMFVFDKAQFHERIFFLIIKFWINFYNLVAKYINIGYKNSFPIFLCNLHNKICSNYLQNSDFHRGLLSP